MYEPNTTDNLFFPTVYHWWCVHCKTVGNYDTAFTTHIADSRGGVAEDHYGRAVVVVHQGPQVAARAHDRPLSHDILAGVRVALEINVVWLESIFPNFFLISKHIFVAP